MASRQGLINELEKRTGHKVIGNKSASGTAIIDELGEEEVATRAYDRLHFGGFCTADLRAGESL